MTEWDEEPPSEEWKCAVLERLNEGDMDILIK
jgi:hypothetical protein